MTFSDGLGWGSPYLYVCFNDDCSLYSEGWGNLMDNYASVASYRCICDPMSQNRQWDCMPVFSPEGGRGCIIDEQLREQELALKKAQKEGLEILDECARTKNDKGILNILFNMDTLPPVAFRAAELIEEIGGLDVIEPLRNYHGTNAIVKERVAESIAKIHSRFFTKECPFCAEIIKSRAIVCKHCGKEVS
jgi:hypothetical protein